MRSLLHTAHLAGCTVLLRADLNVPLKGETIISNFKLDALRPTLDLLAQQGAKTIIATHLGRPKGFDLSLSTNMLTSWFIQNGYTLSHAATIEQGAAQKKTMQPGTFLLLENLRFMDEERDSSLPSSRAYAQSLKNLADYYVNDAWGVSHKKDTSLTLVPSLFDQGKKTIGLLIEREVEGLEPLLNPERPFVLIMGGSKIPQKLPLIEKALDVADSIIVLPALAYTFLKAHGKDVGKSLVDDSVLQRASEILEHAQEKGKELILPVDFTYGSPDLSNLDPTVEVGNHIPPTMRGIALGPKSLEQCNEVISQAQSILVNGMMGFFEYPKTLEPQKKLLQSIAQSDAYSVIGGGDSVAAVKLCERENDFSFLSTGGGATLNYILYRKTQVFDYLE